MQNRIESPERSELDQAIVRRYLRGQSMEFFAKRHKVSLAYIQSVIDRDAPENAAEIIAAWGEWYKKVRERDDRAATLKARIVALPWDAPEEKRAALRAEIIACEALIPTPSPL